MSALRSNTELDSRLWDCMLAWKGGCKLDQNTYLEVQIPKWIKLGLNRMSGSSLPYSHELIGTAETRH